MRFITGVLVGIVLTIGFAYVVDQFQSAPGPGGKEATRMVNWDVVDAHMRGLSSDAQDAWSRLVGGAKKLDKQTGA